MSTLRHPVGPQPPSVYWRRRLVVLLGLLAIVVVVVLIVWNGGRGSGEARETPRPVEDASPTPDPTAECDPAVLVVEPVIDATGDPGTYAAGVLPVLSMTITNAGAAACSYDVGTLAQEYRIVSGSDPIWNSRDCQDPADPAGSYVMVLEAGTTYPTERGITWDRTRSSPDTCDVARSPVIAGGATYRLSVRLGDVESEGDRAFLLY